MGKVYSRVRGGLRRTPATKHSAQLKGTEEAKTVRDQGRRDARHGRAVRRDEGDARRLLPRRGRLDRRGARSSPRRSRPRASAAPSRSGRSWRCSGAVHAAHLRRTRATWSALDRRRACATLMQGYGRLNGDLRAAGRLVRGDELQPVSTATSVRVRNGEHARHRRAVRRDEGSPRRLLPHRGRDARRGDRVGLANPRRAERHHRGAAGRRPLGDGE